MDKGREKDKRGSSSIVYSRIIADLFQQNYCGKVRNWISERMSEISLYLLNNSIHIIQRYVHAFRLQTQAIQAYTHKQIKKVDEDFINKLQITRK